MKAKAKMGAKIEAQLTSYPAQEAKALTSVHWEWEHYRDGKLIDEWDYKNVCVDEGLNSILNVQFHGATQITTWYVGIFNTDTTPAAGTTYAVPVWTESIAYDNIAVRATYVEAEAASKSITNSANKAAFTMSGTEDIYGAFLCGGGSAATTRQDTAGGGTIYCAGKFGASKSVVDNDVLSVTITITVADT